MAKDILVVVCVRAVIGGVTNVSVIVSTHQYWKLSIRPSGVTKPLVTER